MNDEGQWLWQFVIPSTNLPEINKNVHPIEQDVGNLRCKAHVRHEVHGIKIILRAISTGVLW